MKLEKGKLVVLFDGVCNFCNGSVNFIIERDKYDTFRFAVLQSEIGLKLQKELGINHENIESIILIDRNKHKFYKKTSAALRITKHLKFPWNLSYIFILVPSFIRNIVYDIISRNRYKWFGKRGSCRIPTNEEKRKFL